MCKESKIESSHLFPTCWVQKTLGEKVPPAHWPFEDYYTYWGGESLGIACITHLHSDDFLSVFLLSIFKQVTAQLLLAPPQVILVTCKSPFVVRFLKTGQVCHKKIDQKTSVNMNIKMNISPIFFKQRCRFLFQLLPSRKAIGINTRILPCLVFHVRCWELPVSI